MSEVAEKVKVSQRSRGKLLALSTLFEGNTPSFDGTKIAYRSFGKGSLPVVCANGLGVGTFFWDYFERHFRTSSQVVTWDYRGHGKSELKKNLQNYSLDALVQDGKAVMDKLKLKKAVFVGHSLGVQVILEIYRRWPERVAGLVLCFGTYGHPMDHFYNTPLSRYIFKVCHLLGTTFPKPSNFVSKMLLDNPLSFYMGGLFKIMHTGMMKKEDSDKYVKHILSVDPVFFISLLKSAQEHTAENILRSIDVPTLIVSGDMDQFTPPWISKKMHRLIPESELFMIPHATHAGLVEQPDLVNFRIEKFIEERI